MCLYSEAILFHLDGPQKRGYGNLHMYTPYITRKLEPRSIELCPNVHLIMFCRCIFVIVGLYLMGVVPSSLLQQRDDLLAQVSQ